MEGYELRRIRRAHRLSTEEMARLVDVTASDVQRWEAAPGSLEHKPIERDARKRMLQKLAALRDEQRRAAQKPPRSIPAGFSSSAADIRLQ